jgi:PiT family inorganic phosphate transporter
MQVIAEHGHVLMILALVLGLYMTWGIGANDVANAMGTSTGSGAVTVKQAILIAAIFEFLGAFLAGGSVTATIRSGIIDPQSLAGSPEVLVYGMLAALLGAGLWLSVASWWGWPVSTSHTIVGGLVGFGVAAMGVDSVQWGKILTIVASWIVSPAVGGLLGYLLMMSVQVLILRTRSPAQRARTWGPAYVFLAGLIVSLVTLFKGLKHLNIDLSGPASLSLSVLFALLLAGIARIMINRTRDLPDAPMDVQFSLVEKAFAPMMLFAACAMAFAHGSNDVANGIGPLAAVISILDSGGSVVTTSAVPAWVLAFGGVGIVIGLATLGFRVMRTIGKSITTLTPSRGYCATLAAASTVVLASKTGLPVSTTHITVGAVMGVGMTGGLAAINLRVLRGIVLSWLITVPAGAIMAIGFFFMFKGMFGIDCPPCAP